MSVPLKVLLTGASGFVGSHVLDELCKRRIATRLLLRRTSDTRFIEEHLTTIEVHHGSLNDPDALRRSLDGVNRVIHCAGITKAVRTAEFYEANQTGTRFLLEAINESGEAVERLVHISSLAASYPAAASSPAREDTPPNPVSEYGRSKLAAERAVRDLCKCEFTILRPPAVYGPRDRDFLRLFKAVRIGFVPRSAGGQQALSLVFVRDLAGVIVDCLTHRAVAGRIYNVASDEVVATDELIGGIARQMNARPFHLPAPKAVLWSLCLFQETLSRITKRPNILNRDKYRELRAPGWVCDTSRLQADMGPISFTTLRNGITETLDWYRRNKWL